MLKLWRKLVSYGQESSSKFSAPTSETVKSETVGTPSTKISPPVSLIVDILLGAKKGFSFIYAQKESQYAWEYGRETNITLYDEGGKEVCLFQQICEPRQQAYYLLLFKEKRIELTRDEGCAVLIAHQKYLSTIHRLAQEQARKDLTYLLENV